MDYKRCGLAVHETSFLFLFFSLCELPDNDTHFRYPRHERRYGADAFKSYLFSRSGITDPGSNTDDLPFMLGRPSNRHNTSDALEPPLSSTGIRS